MHLIFFLNNLLEDLSEQSFTVPRALAVQKHSIFIYRSKGTWGGRAGRGVGKGLLVQGHITKPRQSNYGAGALQHDAREMHSSG